MVNEQFNSDKPFASCQNLMICQQRQYRQHASKAPFLVCARIKWLSFIVCSRLPARLPARLTTCLTTDDTVSERTCLAKSKATKFAPVRRISPVFSFREQKVLPDARNVIFIGLPALQSSRNQELDKKHAAMFSFRSNISCFISKDE